MTRAVLAAAPYMTTLRLCRTAPYSSTRREIRRFLLPRRVVGCGLPEAVPSQSPSISIAAPARWLFLPSSARRNPTAAGCSMGDTQFVTIDKV